MERGETHGSARARHALTRNGPEPQFDAGDTGCLDGDNESLGDLTITLSIQPAKGIIER